MEVKYPLICQQRLGQRLLEPKLATYVDEDDDDDDDDDDDNDDDMMR
jgi:hypothetical protein